MGNGYVLGCSNCGNSITLTLGCGMMDWNVKEILPQIHYTRRSEIEDIIRTKNITEEIINHQIYTCPKCNNFASRMYVKIVFDGGCHETTFKCGKCKTIMTEWQGNEFSELNCPSCKAKSLTIECELNWD